MTPLSHHRNVHHVAYYYYYYYRRVDPADAFLPRRQYGVSVVQLVRTALTFACPPASDTPWHCLKVSAPQSVPICCPLLTTWMPQT